MASSSITPDLDFTDHHNYNVDDHDNSSPSQDYNIPENGFDDNDNSSPTQGYDIPEDNFDYNDDNFLDHGYNHDFPSAYLSYPADIIPLPCSTTSQTLDTPSSSLSDASNNLNLNKEMSTEPMPNTACPDTGSD